MNRLIVWFLQKFPAPDRRAIYRAALGDLNHVRRREFLMRLIAGNTGMIAISTKIPAAPTPPCRG